MADHTSPPVISCQAGDYGHCLGERGGGAASGKKTTQIIPKINDRNNHGQDAPVHLY